MEPNLNTIEAKCAHTKYEMPFISPYKVINISPLWLLRLHIPRFIRIKCSRLEQNTHTKYKINEKKQTRNTG